MDPDAVLTEQQRQARFRKAIERRSRLQSSEHRDANDSDNSSPERIGVGSRSNPIRSNLFPPMSDDPFATNRWTKLFQPKIEMIMKTYQAAMNGDDSSEKLFRKLDKIFAGDSPLEMDKKTLFENINKMFEEFERFANFQR